MQRMKRWAMHSLVLLVCIGLAVAYWLNQRGNALAVAPVIQSDRLAGQPSAYTPPSNYSEHLQQLRSFQSQAGRLAYADYGPADASKTLVLVHGVPTSSWMYRKLIPMLQQHVRVIAIDLLGYGASEKPRDDPALYAHAAQASYVTELLKHLRIEEFALLVHDMGGLVAWELMRANASISELVLLNTIVRQEGFNNPTMEQGMMTEAVMKAYSAPLSSSALLQGTFNELGLTGEHTLSEAECEGYVRPLQTGSDKALYAFFTGLNTELFERLEGNATFIANWPGRWRVFWGGKDGILTTGQLPFLRQHAGLTDADITVFAQHSHFLAEEAPAEIAAGVVEFLTQP